MLFPKYIKMKTHLYEAYKIGFFIFVTHVNEKIIEKSNYSYQNGDGKKHERDWEKSKNVGFKRNSSAMNIVATGMEGL